MVQGLNALNLNVSKFYKTIISRRHNHSEIAYGVNDTESKTKAIKDLDDILDSKLYFEVYVDYN